MYATLTVIRPDVYALCREDMNSEGISLEGPRFDIDKSWSDFHEAFCELGGPLINTIEGDFRPDGGFDDQEDATYCAFASPDAVKEICDALTATSWASLKPILARRWRAAVGRSMPKDQQSYLEHHFNTLCAAYRAASEADSALFINIC
jgi:hypothetical protein